MNMDDYLDTLGDLIDDGWAIPLSGGKVAVEAARVREIIEDIRLNAPSEIKQAKLIVADRSDIIAKARAEAEHIIRTAEERAAAMIKQDEIHRRATEQARELLEQSQTKSREMRRAATDFAETVLRNTEEALSASVNEVRQARSALRIPRNADK